MSRTEDLLREALASTPVDPHADVLHGLDRRIRRARRRVAAAAGVAAAAVVAAAVVPLATLAHGGSRGDHVATTNTPAPRPTPGARNPAVWLPSGGMRVATGDDGTPDDNVWVLADARTPRSADLVGIDSRTGSVRYRFTVPGPVDDISVGLGYVWAYGGGDAGYSNVSVIDRVNPRTAAVSTLHIEGKGAPSSMAFTAQGAYVSLAVADQVVRVSGVTGSLSLDQRLTVPGQPDFMTVVGDGTVWVEETLAKKWVHLDVAEGRMTLLGTAQWPSRLFGPSHDEYLWTTDSPNRVVELSPAMLSAGVSVAYGNRVRTPGLATAVVAQAGGTGGVFVATVDALGASPSDETGIAYYSAQAVAAGGPPTARLHDVNTNTLVAAADGGVVFVSDSGSVEHWTP